MKKIILLSTLLFSSITFAQIHAMNEADKKCVNAIMEFMDKNPNTQVGVKVIEQLIKDKKCTKN